MDFAQARSAARRLGLPFALTVHDDLRYALRGRPDRAIALRALGRAWRDADHRFVISHALGEEYSRRYGALAYQVVTDGLADEEIAPAPRPTPGLRVYFAGLFHLAYASNFHALLDALDLLASERPAVTVTSRSGALPGVNHRARVPVRILPFGTEQEVMSDLKNADALYLPMPFGESHRDFLRFSLSTKLITYLGGGLPILYHGPAEGAAYELLEENNAAIMLTSHDPRAIAHRMLEGLNGGETVVQNALRLARRQFLLTDQRSRFWSEIGYPLPRPESSMRTAS